MPVKRAKKIVKKNMKSYPRRKLLSGAGYKGHHPGTAKEAIHRLYDKFGPVKARPMALRLVAPATVNTSWSQFKKYANNNKHGKK